MEHLAPEDLVQLRAALAALPDVVRRAAEGRLVDGSYGLCVSCGDELDVASLTASPARAWCAPCEADVVRRRRAVRHGVCGQRGEEG